MIQFFLELITVRKVACLTRLYWFDLLLVFDWQEIFMHEVIIEVLRHWWQLEIMKKKMANTFLMGELIKDRVKHFHKIIVLPKIDLIWFDLNRIDVHCSEWFVYFTKLSEQKQSRFEKFYRKTKHQPCLRSNITRICVGFEFWYDTNGTDTMRTRDLFRARLYKRSRQTHNAWISKTNAIQTEGSACICLYWCIGDCDCASVLQLHRKR